MISPDVDAAAKRLGREGILVPEQVRLFGRIARGELVSASRAIQALLYLGVLALTTGTGLLLRDEIANLGPLTLSVFVGLGAIACLAWVRRISGPYSDGAVPSPHVAFDYILALGALLAAADLAFIEAQFSPLGDQWTWHLLLVSAFYGGLAFRFDSRSLLALALTTFAAWRGVAATFMERSLFGFFDDTVTIRVNALFCGLIFILAGRLLVQRRIKVHFEPTAVHLGWLLVLQAIAWGIGGGAASSIHRLTLMLVGGGLAWFAWRGGRFALFVFGILAAYLAVFAVVADAVDEPTLILLLVACSAIGLVFALAGVHRRFPKEAQE